MVRPSFWTAQRVAQNRFSRGRGFFPPLRGGGRFLNRPYTPCLPQKIPVRLDGDFPYKLFFPIRRAETVRSVQRRITRVLLVFRQAPCRTVWLPALPGDWSGGFTRLPSSTISQARVCPPGLPAYLAYSTALVSRMTLTLIWPGYSSSASIFLAMSRARRIMLSSLTTSGLTMMRISRPAWMA